MDGTVWLWSGDFAGPQIVLPREATGGTKRGPSRTTPLCVTHRASSRDGRAMIRHENESKDAVLGGNRGLAEDLLQNHFRPVAAAFVQDSLDDNAMSEHWNCQPLDVVGDGVGPTLHHRQALDGTV